MKTEFKEKLEKILDNCFSNEHYHRPSARDDLRKLFYDVVLKAIGEDEIWTHGDYPGHIERNELRSEIKAKLYAELGIKEK